MGYRDNFYVVGNIIGYTGLLQASPTVYFETADEYGHITQFYRKKSNVGREQVKETTQYTGGNEEIEGEIRFVERRYGHIVHKSREKLIEVKQTDTDTLALLAQAITKCTELKSKYDGLVTGGGPSPEQDDES